MKKVKIQAYTTSLVFKSTGILICPFLKDLKNLLILFLLEESNKGPPFYTISDLDI